MISLLYCHCVKQISPDSKQISPDSAVLNIENSHTNPGCSVRAPGQNLPFAGTAGKVVEFSLRMPAVLGSSPVVTGQKFLN